jgi:manganese/zinc/iron transport system substrate-binding protein
MKGLAIVLVWMALIASCTCNKTCQKYREEEKQWYERNGKLKVLSTTAMIDDIVKRVGGDEVDTLTLIKGGLDPHSYQLVKGDDEKLAYADVIFYNGLGLEHGPSLQELLAEQENSFAVGDAIYNRTPDRILQYNGQVDPHIWMDISLWNETVPTIVDKLSQYDPKHAALFKRNGEQVMQELRTAHNELRAKLQAIPDHKRYLVTSHDAFNYFTRAYLATDREISTNTWQKRFAAPEGLSPESQLSAADIQQIIDHLKLYKIHVIFSESNVSRDSIRKIVQSADDNGLQVTIATAYLYGDAMGEPGSEADTYVKMVTYNGRTIASFLEGEK